MRQAVGSLLAAARSGELDAICERLGVRILGIFGSAANDRDREPRDLDVAVSFGGSPLVLDLLDELTRITSFDQIDLVMIDGADPVLRAAAWVGTPLYEDEPGAYAIEQMAALAEMRDTEHLRRLDLRTLTT